jgi:hypothetical protein
MPMSHNDLVMLLVQTLATTIVARAVLDLATSWTAYESRNEIVANVLLGWCMAVILLAYVLLSGLGAIAASVACILHVAGILRERTMRPSGPPFPKV